MVDAGIPLIPGPYRVRKEICSGRSRVFLCEDEQRGKNYVVKEQKGVFAAAKETASCRLFTKLCHLIHPNVVRMHRVECDAEDNAYLVMDYIKGETVPVKRERPDVEFKPGLDHKKLTILRDIAAALDYIHRCGVLHLDVKPSNILVTEDGHAKLIDFDLAALTEDGKVDPKGRKCGTPPYMAPEMWQGQSPTPATDQWSLAAFAYELICGHLPHLISVTPEFWSEDFPLYQSWSKYSLSRIDRTLDRTRSLVDDEFMRQMGNAIICEDVKDIEVLTPSANAAMRKALAKISADRHESCRAFVDALSASYTLEDPSVASSFESATHLEGVEEESYAERRVQKTMLKVAIVGAIALAAIIIIEKNDRRDHDTIQWNESPNTDVAPHCDTAQKSPVNGDRNLYDQADGLYSQGDYAGATRLLVQVSNHAEPMLKRKASHLAGRCQLKLDANDCAKNWMSLCGCVECQAEVRRIVDSQKQAIEDRRCAEYREVEDTKRKMEQEMAQPHAVVDMRNVPVEISDSRFSAIKTPTNGMVVVESEHVYDNDGRVVHSVTRKISSESQGYAVTNILSRDDGANIGNRTNELDVLLSNTAQEIRGGVGTGSVRTVAKEQTTHVGCSEIKDKDNVNATNPIPVSADKQSDNSYCIYTVQPGDTLSKICKCYCVRTDSVRRLNPEIKRDQVRIGQKIKLPGRAVGNATSEADSEHLLKLKTDTGGNTSTNNSPGINRERKPGWAFR